MKVQGHITFWNPVCDISTVSPNQKPRAQKCLPLLPGVMFPQEMQVGNEVGKLGRDRSIQSLFESQVLL